MGGRSSSSSRSTTSNTTTTENYQNTGQASDNAVQLQGNFAGATITDGGATQAALDFASDFGDDAFTFGDDALQAVRGGIVDALDFASKTNDSANALVANAQDTARTAIIGNTQAAQFEISQQAEKSKQYVIFGAVGLGALALFTVMKRG